MALPTTSASIHTLAITERTNIPFPTSLPAATPGNLNATEKKHYQDKPQSGFAASHPTKKRPNALAVPAVQLGTPAKDAAVPTPVPGRGELAVSPGDADGGTCKPFSLCALNRRRANSPLFY